MHVSPEVLSPPRSPSRPTRTLLKALTLALFAGGTPACQSPESAPKAGAAAAPSAAVRPSAGPKAAATVPAPGLPSDTLVTVNGVPITEADIRHESKGDVHGALPDEGKRQLILEGLIQRELMRQSALSRRLEQQPEYLKRRENLEAQIRAFERVELPAALFRDLLAEAQVSEAEAKAWYEANEKRVGVEVHILQLMAKSRAAADAMKAELDAGKPFEDVARAQFPNLPAGNKAPWDLGFLHWGKMPAPWLPVVFDAPDGQATSLIEGAGNRFWILKVVEKRPAAPGAFEVVKEAVAERLRAERVGKLQSELEAAARKSAVIVRTPARAPAEE